MITASRRLSCKSGEREIKQKSMLKSLAMALGPQLRHKVRLLPTKSDDTTGQVTLYNDASDNSIQGLNVSSPSSLNVKLDKYFQILEVLPT